MAEGVQFMSLFSGAGGGVTGVKQAGYSVCCAVDNDENAVNTLRKNHEDVNVIEEDLSATSPDEFSSMYGIEVEDVDGIIGGPPCQGFSIAGNRDSDDERNELVTDFLKYVEFFDPEMVIMENVVGILSMDGGSFVETVHDTLDSLGYESEHRTLSASDFGVPQKRERVFFVARQDGSPGFPTPTGEAKTVGDVLTHDGSEPNMTAPRHQQKTIDRIQDTDQGEALYDSYTQRIRLDEDDVAPTLVSGGPRPQWQLAHPTEDRGLTVRERAALQTFPDDYVFEGGVVSGRVQTGNAVPPRLAKAVVEAI